MKVWLVGVNTFRALRHNRAVLGLILFFLFVLLSTAGAIYFGNRLQRAGAAEQAELLFAQAIERLLGVNAVFCFLLAAVVGAYVLPSEIKSGTVVPTLGRALSRRQFLLGLFLGLNLLLVAYLLLVSVAAAGLMLWGGVTPAPTVLLGALYVVLVANIVAALAFFFATLVSTVVALAAVFFFLQLRSMVEAIKLLSRLWGERLERVFDYLLPAWSLLDYGSYLSLTREPLARGAEFYLLGIGHAVTYGAVFLLLALVIFRRRSLLTPG